MLGVNVDPLAGYTIDDVARYEFVRVPLWQDVDVNVTKQFLADAQNRDIRTLGVCDYRSLYMPRGKSYTYKFERLKREYGDLLDYWEIGNEPDQEGESSWTMTPERFSDLLHTASKVLNDRYIISGGLASGLNGVSYLHDVGRLPVDGIAIHAYGNVPDGWNVPEGWPIPGYMSTYFSAFLEFGKPIWVTEWGAQDGLFNNTLEREQYHILMRYTLRAHHSAVFCKCGLPEFDIHGKFELV